MTIRSMRVAGEAKRPALDTIKGGATGTITVHSALRSFSYCDAILFDPPFHDPPLQRGDSALFLTWWDQRDGVYDLLELDDGYFQIDDDADRAALVDRFTRAVQATPVASPVATAEAASPTATP